MLFDKTKTKLTGNALRTRLLAAGAAVCLGLSVTPGAMAASVVVEDWMIELNNTFSTFKGLKQACNDGDTTYCDDIEPMGSDYPDDIVGNVTGTSPNPVLGGSTKIEWPDPEGDGGNSFVQLGDNGNGTFSGTHTTNAGFFPTVVISHGNFTQNLHTDFLFSALLEDELKFKAVSPAPFTMAMPGPEVMLSLNIDVTFIETVNNANSDQNPTDSIDDLFIFHLDPLAGWIELGPNAFGIQQPFLYTDTMGGMVEYLATLKLEGITPGTQGFHMLTDAQCELAGVSTDPDDQECIGLTTREGTLNEFQAFFSVVHRAPEPGALAVFGLGLAGLGLIRRRRKV